MIEWIGKRIANTVKSRCESLDSDWLEQPNDGTKRWRILAWAWEEEANAYFMGLFYRTPQPVLDYIDTWNETGKETKTPFTILH